MLIFAFLSIRNACDCLFLYISVWINPANLFLGYSGSVPASPALTGTSTVLTVQQSGSLEGPPSDLFRAGPTSRASSGSLLAPLASTTRVVHLHYTISLCNISSLLTLINSYVIDDLLSKKFWRMLCNAWHHILAQTCKKYKEALCQCERKEMMMSCHSDK